MLDMCCPVSSSLNVWLRSWRDSNGMELFANEPPPLKQPLRLTVK